MSATKNFPRLTVQTGDKIVRVTWNAMQEAIFERDGDKISLICIEKRPNTATRKTLEPTLRNVPDRVVEVLEAVEGFEVVGDE